MNCTCNGQATCLACKEKHWAYEKKKILEPLKQAREALISLANNTRFPKSLPHWEKSQYPLMGMINDIQKLSIEDIS